jgi:hypothetical protein
MNPSLLFHLPPPLAAAVLNFLTRPAQEADPQRLAGALPPGWPLPLSAAAQRAVQQPWHLDTGRDVELLDPAQPLHRLALLPRAALATLARQLALHDQAARLRRVVLRSERQALAPHIEATDWAWLLSPAAGSPAQALAEPALHELPHWLDTVGWALLEAAATLLPTGLAQRLQLKLRPAPATGPGLALPAELARQRVLARYPGAAATWSPRWEPDWQAWLAHAAPGA